MVGTIDWPSGRVCTSAGIRVMREKGAEISNGMSGKDAVRDRGLPIVARDAGSSVICACPLSTATR